MQLGIFAKSYQRKENCRVLSLTDRKQRKEKKESGVEKRFLLSFVLIHFPSHMCRIMSYSFGMLLFQSLLALLVIDR